MSALDELERRFQARHAYDDAHMFRVRSRRARLAGLWAGGLLRLAPDELDRYVEALVEGGDRGPGGADLRSRIVADLRAGGVEISDHRVEKRLLRLLEEARIEIMTG